MDAGFRRSGRMLYQPVCRACRDCVAIRVPVARFAAGRSQRRCWRRNLDLSVTVGRPSPTPEKHDLYARYLDARHDGQQDASPEGLEAFLYDSPVETLEFEYRDPRGALRAVGICDASERSLSSVYFYFDPAEARRGLGTFGVLQEIAFCRSVGIGHYYLGFWVAGTATMDYKAQFRPAEVLGTDGLWRPAP
jgi:arginine-tRNA-protein transferase